MIKPKEPDDVIWLKQRQWVSLEEHKAIVDHLLKERNICGNCFTSSFEPCDPGTEGAFQDPKTGVTIHCAYCALERKVHSPTKHPEPGMVLSLPTVPENKYWRDRAEKYLGILLEFRSAFADKDFLNTVSALDVELEYGDRDFQMLEWTDLSMPPHPVDFTPVLYLMFDTISKDYRLELVHKDQSWYPSHSNHDQDVEVLCWSYFDVSRFQTGE